MPDLVYGPAAIEHARVTVAAEARRLPALTDLLGPETDPAAGLAAGGALSGALADLRAAVEAELTAAAARLTECDRALDATLGAVRAADDDLAVSSGPGAAENVAAFSASGLGAVADVR